MTLENATPSKPWWKKIPWQGWVAILAVLLIAGFVQNVSNGSNGATPTRTTEPTSTPLGEPVNESAGIDWDLVGGADVADHVSKGLGNADLDEACSQDIKWACNVTEITVNTAKQVTITITQPAEGVQPVGIAMGFKNFITTPLDDNTTTPLPDLQKVTVEDTSGTVLSELTV